MYGEARYERLRERVLGGGWHVLTDRFAVRGATATPVTFLEGSLDEPLMITSGGDGVRVLSNVCSHRGALLLDAPCQSTSIRCPYHGRRFSLDGALVTAPGFDRVEGEDLPRLPLATWGPLLFTSLAPRVSLEDALAPVRERLAFLDLDALEPDPESTRAFELDAHFLLWCENYLEGLHIPYVHPRLARALALERYEVHVFERCALQIGEAAPDEPAFALPPGHPDFGRRVGGYYLFLHPTTALNFYPWGLSLNLVRPLGPRRTRIEYRAYVGDESLRERGAGAGLDAVELEDDAIVLRAQRGVASRLYRPGALHPEHERAVAWLHRAIEADLG